MSTQGGGSVGLVFAAPVAISIGAGILIKKGITLCGDLLEGQYQAECQKHAELVDAARHYLLLQEAPLFAKRLETLSLEIAAQTEQQAEETTGPDSVQQEALHQVKTRIRSLLDNIGASMPSAQEVKRENLLLQLTRAIESNRALLPPHMIAQAESARNGSLNDIRQAITMLEEAYQEVETAESRLARQQREVQHTLRFVKVQLRALDEMLSQAESLEQPEFIERRSTLTALIDTAESGLDTELARAQQLVEEARRVTYALTEAVSTFLSNAWADIHSRVSEQIGILNTLKGMLEDAKTTKMAEETRLNELMQRVTPLYNDAEAIRQSSSLRVAQRLGPLTTRTEFLKDDVFALVEAYQQQTIAETIATTLDELGFQSVGSEAPTVQINGDMMRVRAMRTGETAEGRSDDKLITFDVSSRGNVSYDFSGYDDEACVKEAERIFGALRSAGVFLFDSDQLNHLLEAYPEGVPKHMLDRLQLQPTANKLQMELAKRIQLVLEQMHFEHIQESSVGGSIELDAFNGSFGYRVVLSPEGTLQVSRDGELIDSTDLFGEVVAEAQQVIMEQEQEKEVEDSQAEEPESKRETYREQQKKRLFES